MASAGHEPKRHSKSPPIWANTPGFWLLCRNQVFPGSSQSRPALRSSPGLSCVFWVVWVLQGWPPTPDHRGHMTQPESPTAAATNHSGRDLALSQPCHSPDFNLLGLTAWHKDPKQSNKKLGRAALIVPQPLGGKKQRSDESKVVLLPLVLTVLPVLTSCPWALSRPGKTSCERSHLRLVFTKKFPSHWMHKEIKSESPNL